MKIAVLQFPGSGSDRDTVDVFRHGLGLSAELVWHKETGFGEADLVVLPGGFAFGDYLRCGAIASHSPIMQAVKDHADRGGLVLGVGNGFQILCEAGLLPGALIENVSLEFRSERLHWRWKMRPRLGNAPLWAKPSACRSLTEKEIIRPTMSFFSDWRRIIRFFFVTMKATSPRR